MPAAVVVAAAAALSNGITNTQIENAQGLEQLAAIESIVHAANAALLASRIRETKEYLEAEQDNFLDHIDLTNPDNNPNPGGPEHWTRELIKKLQNMKDVLKRLPGAQRVQWEKTIQALQNMLPK